MEVFSADNQNLGKVALIGEETFVVEKGFFFPKGYTFAGDAVAEVSGGSVRLALRQDEIGEKSSGPESTEIKKGDPPLVSALRLEEAERMAEAARRGEAEELLRKTGTNG